MTDRTQARRYLKVGAITNALDQSLFFVPFSMMAGSVVLSQVAVALDRWIGGDVLPEWFQTSPESSRSILTAAAGGTITAASIVFSLTLVAVQLAASQFSPRVLQGFLGDRFQQVVMGTVIGTFAYSLLLLREVQPAGDSVPRAFVPQLSITIAMVLAVMSLVAVLASIDHTAKGLRVGTVADDILSSTVDTIERLYPARCADRSEHDGLLPEAPSRAPASQITASDVEQDSPEDANVIDAPRTGWITGVQVEALASTVPEGTSIMLVSPVGTYVVEGTPLLRVWSVDAEHLEALESELASLVRIGDVRTMQQDVGFGIVQLVDIALRALSPGINDPHTAGEVVVRLGALVTSLYRRSLPSNRTEVDGRWLLRPDEPDYSGYVDLAFEPIRRNARTEPHVIETLIRTVAGIRRDAERRFGDPDVSALDRILERVDDELDQLGTTEDRRRIGDVLASTRR